jgi:hypothetical protein
MRNPGLVALVVLLVVSVAFVGAIERRPVATVESPTESSPTSAASPTVGDDCDAVDRETAAPVHEPTPKPLPERPDRPTPDGAAEFALAFEEAYRYNGHLDRGTTDQHVEASSARVEDVPEGHVVRLESFAYGYVDDDPDRTESETPAWDFHWDGERLHVAYLVTDDRVLRAAQSSPETTPDPREGTVVAC